jgi:hypothetical protein
MILQHKKLVCPLYGHLPPCKKSNSTGVNNADKVTSDDGCVWQLMMVSGKNPRSGLFNRTLAVFLSWSSDCKKHMIIPVTGLIELIERKKREKRKRPFYQLLEKRTSQFSIIHRSGKNGTVHI